MLLLMTFFHNLLAVSQLQNNIHLVTTYKICYLYCSTLSNPKIIVASIFDDFYGLSTTSFPATTGVPSS